MQTEHTSPTGTRLPWGDQGAYAPTQVGSKRALAAEAPWRLATNARFPDTILDSCQVGSVTVRTASTRGPSHRYYGTTREDSVAVVNIGGHLVAAAVADGLGSEPASDQAAYDAVRVCVLHLHQQLVESAGTDNDVRAAIRAAVEVVGDALRRYRKQGDRPATTLSLAVLRTEPSQQDGGYESWVARVGDSPAYLLAAGNFQPLFEAETGEPGELHSPATDGLPSASLAEALAIRRERLEPRHALVIATDGLGTPLRFEDVRTYLAQAWQAGPSAPEEFLRQVQFRRRSFDDDRSAVVMWAGSRGRPEGGGPAVPAEPVRAVGGLREPGTVSILRKLLHPDAVLEAGRAGDLEIRAASVRGAHERQLARPRQQAIGVVAVGDARIAAALAEGTWSDTAIQAGWQHAVELLLRRLQALPPAGAALDDVASAVLQTGPDLFESGVRKSPGTTLIVALVDTHPSPDTLQHRFTVARIGCSPAYLLASECRPLFDHADPAASATLPEPGTAPSVYTDALYPGDALVLAAANLDLLVRGQLGARWRTVPGPIEFLHTLQTEDVPADRDRSGILIAVPRGES